MNIAYQFLDGRKGGQSFVSVAEFIMLQDREVPAIDDSAKVLSVEIDGEPYEFSGNVADLFFELNKK
ncbi:hypothetical protein [Lactococcus fujiensis]|uniref:Uncharacterized protein n=2 Tax=Lactococcus fujiensis TaxID=610251 RepID=A0A2A5RLT2_9LACT|nr:hypothetical protein [Lactococcus fujiensis]PCS00218.1 hypothetical protein RT41_GL001529 [Lactococcus fujiensis JCM 16395]